MIIVKIMGGYGNQMFQYAFAYYLKQFGKKIKLDLSYYDKIPEIDTPRKCGYNLFGLDLPIATKVEFFFYQRLFNFIRFFSCSKFNFLYVQQDSTTIEDRVFYFKTAYLIGYWQNFSSVKPNLELLRKVYSERLYNRLSLKSKELLEQIKLETDAVSIHVRGGDYLNKFNKDKLGAVCSKEYYEKALKKVKENVQNPKFYVFTNDRNYSLKMLPSTEDYTYIQTDDSEGLDDLFLMTACKHHIIANSSFSWWGAILGVQKDGIVIEPFGKDDYGNRKNLYNDDFIKI